MWIIQAYGILNEAQKEEVSMNFDENMQSSYINILDSVKGKNLNIKYTAILEIIKIRIYSNNKSPLGASLA
ncbi:MAG: hypothetical protein LBR55_00865 [Bacteroidales bacterium]|jgi:hypothetical protein|nr:hypothetical protein [Bacteroidales bacterium]